MIRAIEKTTRLAAPRILRCRRNNNRTPTATPMIGKTKPVAMPRSLSKEGFSVTYSISQMERKHVPQ
jgi:hypothetical protein